jgi:hypothetical protein
MAYGRYFLTVTSLLALYTAGCQGNDSDSAPVSNGNNPPIANAGPDVSQPADYPVNLDGQGSYDPDGDPIVFNWSFDHVPAGSQIESREEPFSANHSQDAASTIFLPDAVGTYVVALAVSDGKMESSEDYAIVTVTEPEQRPVADAGPDQNAQLGYDVTLDGSGSYDPFGRDLTFAWSLIEVPPASILSSANLNNPNMVVATFLPDVKGTYVANLIVNNSLSSSTPDSTIINVNADNTVPTAFAGEDFAAEDCTYLDLDCSGSTDPDGDRLSFAWSLQSKPTGSQATSASFTDAHAAATTFWADVAGTYTFSCSVNDGAGWATPDILTVTTTERSYNNPPSVEAGVGRAEIGGESICEEDGYGWDCEDCPSVIVPLNDTAAVEDLDADPLVLLWTVLDGSASIADPSLLLTSATLANASPTEPDVCSDTTYQFQLAASDCPGATVTDTVTYTVTCCGVLDTPDTAARGVHKAAKKKVTATVSKGGGPAVPLALGSVK